MGIEPDGIVGHSVGELGCAYADGSLTGEETVLAAYWRGHCIQQAQLPPGGMAAVGEFKLEMYMYNKIILCPMEPLSRNLKWLHAVPWVKVFVVSWGSCLIF